MVQRHDETEALVGVPLLDPALVARVLRRLLLDLRLRLRPRHLGRLGRRVLGQLALLGGWVATLVKLDKLCGLDGLPHLLRLPHLPHDGVVVVLDLAEILGVTVLLDVVHLRLDVQVQACLRVVLPLPCLLVDVPPTAILRRLVIAEVQGRYALRRAAAPADPPGAALGAALGAPSPGAAPRALAPAPVPGPRCASRRSARATSVVGSLGPLGPLSPLGPLGSAPRSAPAGYPPCATAAGPAPARPASRTPRHLYLQGDPPARKVGLCKRGALRGKALSIGCRPLLLVRRWGGASPGGNHAPRRAGQSRRRRLHA
mmetsp:Transcript_53896/g.144347  ORF Transcript_53896/g.144347 Transcript_53896/m.144347 type:complete len:315 (+) Transcript_53896:1324-2268(+)